ncbi:MAG: BrnT family toxin [Acidobacteria bacterium]|nr:BrnT family toxin [Acidobacteriota bacterium]
MSFDWDAEKASANLKKHGVSFKEASSVFFDPLAATGDDPDHSFGERRFLTFGMSSCGRLLVVAHAEANEVLRIIAARRATRAERKFYEEAQETRCGRTSVRIQTLGFRNVGPREICRATPKEFERCGP